MSKVITFSRTFPTHHPKAGQPTYFVEKILDGLGIDYTTDGYRQKLYETNGMAHAQQGEFYARIKNFAHLLVGQELGLKHHTIRAGSRFRAGDKFSPRVWSGKPYNSPQIIVAPDIQIKKVFDFCIDPLGGEYRMDGVEIPINKLKEISANDGFDDLDDFELWFSVKMGEGFSGQIICWNENISY